MVALSVLGNESIQVQQRIDIRSLYTQQADDDDILLRGA